MRRITPEEGCVRQPDRRRLLVGVGTGFLLLGAGIAAPRTAWAQGLLPTPAQSEGPFYPERIPVDHDADLLQVAGRAPYTAGTPLHLEGTVVDPAGKPFPGARVEIWQCDAEGRYHHSRDRRGPADPDFQGYGRTETRDDGGYAFRTIRPVRYPGRTPHIHFRVTARNGGDLTTQMYVEGEPGNERDFLLNAIRDPEARSRLIVPLTVDGDGLAGRFRIVLRG